MKDLIKKSWPGLSFPFQSLRHSFPAKLLRQLIYYMAIGKKDYPFVFRKFSNKEKLLHYKSPNIYIHIPFCRSLCNHCPYNKIVFEKNGYNQFKKALEKELKYYLKQKNIPLIKTLYFGGGTPSMAPEIIKDVISLMKPMFEKKVEIGVEVHPKDASIESLKTLKEYGVNRISLGIETFKIDLLRKLNRIYDKKQALSAIQNAKKIKFECLDVNIIYGIPGQQIQDSIDDVKLCIKLGVDHLSAYPLITFEHTYFGRLIKRGILHEYGDRKRLKAQELITEACIAEGFNQTSVWSFTKQNKSSYTTVTRENYVGFGPGAGSKVDGEFWFNTFSVDEYNKLRSPRPAIILQTTDKFKRLHWLYWQIYNTKINSQKYKQIFNRNLKDDFRLLLFLMNWFGWLKKEGEIYVFNKRGTIWSHRFQMLFSLTFIDDVWTQCQKEPWPKKIVLY